MKKLKIYYYNHASQINSLFYQDIYTKIYSKKDYYKISIEWLIKFEGNNPWVFSEFKLGKYSYYCDIRQDICYFLMDIFVFIDSFLYIKKKYKNYKYYFYDFEDKFKEIIQIVFSNTDFSFYNTKKQVNRKLRIIHKLNKLQKLIIFALNSIISIIFFIKNYRKSCKKTDILIFNNRDRNIKIFERLINPFSYSLENKLSEFNKNYSVIDFPLNITKFSNKYVHSHFTSEIFYFFQFFLKSKIISENITYNKNCFNINQNIEYNNINIKEIFLNYLKIYLFKYKNHTIKIVKQYFLISRIFRPKILYFSESKPRSFYNFIADKFNSKIIISSHATASWGYVEFFYPRNINRQLLPQADYWIFFSSVIKQFFIDKEYSLYNKKSSRLKTFGFVKTDIISMFNRDTTKAKETILFTESALDQDDSKNILNRLLMDYSAIQNKYNLIIKLHPIYGFGLEKFIKEKKKKYKIKRLSIFTKKDIYEVLSYSDYHISTCSNTVLDALLFNMPSILYFSGKNFDLFDYLGKGIAVNRDNFKNLESAIFYLKSETFLYRFNNKIKLLKQDYFGKVDGKVAERIVLFCQKLLKK